MKAKLFSSKSSKMCIRDSARAFAYAEGKTSTLTVHRGVELSRALELYAGSTKLERCMDSGAYISLDNAQDGVIRVLDGELELASGSIRTLSLIHI